MWMAHSSVDLDASIPMPNNELMSTTSPGTDQFIHELDNALAEGATGKHDRQIMGKAIEALKRSQEETRKRIGVVDVAVELIRDARNQ